MSATTTSVLRAGRIALPLLAIAVLGAACGPSHGHRASGHAAAGGTAGQVSIQLIDGHLTDGSGRTVYQWVADAPGRSHCTGACANVWPPVTTSGRPTTGPGLTAADLTTLTRSDGARQLAYAGHPLYYFAADSSAGDSKGQGSDSFGAKWWELSGAGDPITTAASTPAEAPSQSQAPAGGGGYGY